MTPAGPAPRRTARPVAPALLLTAYGAQLVGALTPHVSLLVAATVSGIAVDSWVQRRQRQVAALLSRVRADATVRQLLRDLLLVAGLLSLDAHDTATVHLPLVCGLLGFYALHFACQAVGILVRRDRTLPVVTRNVDTSALGLRPAPPALLLRRSAERLQRFGLPATAGLLLTAVMARPVYAAAGIAVSAALALAGTAVLATWLLPGRRAPGEARVLAWLDGWLAEYRPTVGMYFSGGASSAYQANMWLSTLAELDGRPVVVLRERFMMQKIEATGVPVVCIPKVAHLMRLEHSTLKVLIHPANSGKTSQILRVPTIKHAFTNHGESDKLSSCNPYAKAYDEVWVAGPAARERYALADIGVDDRDVVEVGRPQLAPIRPADDLPGGSMTTVLYAPTWEGWTDAPGNTSVLLAGENIVAALLADPDVRLLYKPHPMTGTVDSRAGAATRRIEAMIRSANAERAADPLHGGPAASGDRSPAGPDDREAREAREELARCAAALGRLAAPAFRDDADELERMAVQGRPDPGWAEALREATASWEAAYWASARPWRHQVVTGPRPSLYSCFNQAHLLVSDVSSVVSDYLTSEKPYAVANTTGLGEDEYRAAYPTVRAAAVLTPDASGIPGLLDVVRGKVPDPYAEARRELKEHLLGPSEPSSLARFNGAALSLAARADERRRREEERAREAARTADRDGTPGGEGTAAPGRNTAPAPGTGGTRTPEGGAPAGHGSTDRDGVPSATAAPAAPVGEAGGTADGTVPDTRQPGGDESSEPAGGEAREAEADDSGGALPQQRTPDGTARQSG